MVFLDFEKDLESLYEQLEKVKQIGEKGDLDVAPMIDELEQRIRDTRDELYANLSGWQRVQLSRHPERPYTLYYVKQLAPDFVELHGDRTFGDDKAMVGGIGSIDGQTCVFVGQQKGVNTKLRQYRNFGMPNPEGYRKALRLMKMAERFGFPVISLIDTPGAFPGIEAEQRGQAEAIARNLFEMAQLRTPIISIVIGEGASGGAIGIGLSDRSYMMENTWYSVISPESCSSILWRSWDQKERAAEELHLTAEDMLRFGIIDGVIAEPQGGAHALREEAAEAVKAQVKAAIAELQQLDHDTLVARRIDKYDNIGVYREGDVIQYHSATPPEPSATAAKGTPTKKTTAAKASVTKATPAKATAPKPKPTEKSAPEKISAADATAGEVEVSNPSSNGLASKVVESQAITVEAEAFAKTTTPGRAHVGAQATANPDGPSEPTSSGPADPSEQALGIPGASSAATPRSGVDMAFPAAPLHGRNLGPTISAAGGHTSSHAMTTPITPSPGSRGPERV